LIALGFVFVAAAAGAADINGVAGDDFGLITVEGRIENNDFEKFRSFAVNYPKAIVVFKSPGGALVEGMQIGSLIRMRNFTTLVDDNSYCASACALAWLGGTKRLMTATAKVGFHAGYVVENGLKKEDAVGNALIGSYLSRIGLTDAAVVFATHRGPDEMAWLSVNEAKRFGIDVELVTPKDEPDHDAKPKSAAKPGQAVPEIIPVPNPFPDMRRVRVRTVPIRPDGATDNPETPPKSVPAPEVRKVRTISIRPDGTIVSPKTAPNSVPTPKVMPPFLPTPAVVPTPVGPESVVPSTPGTRCVFSGYNHGTQGSSPTYTCSVIGQPNVRPKPKPAPKASAELFPPDQLCDWRGTERGPCRTVQCRPISGIGRDGQPFRSRICR
jgi:hypothetical protein